MRMDDSNNSHKTYIRNSAGTRWFTTGNISKLTLCFLFNRVMIQTVRQCKIEKRFLQIDLVL